LELLRRQPVTKFDLLFGKSLGIDLAVNTEVT
jgi:hypothetical protein